MLRNMALQYNRVEFEYSFKNRICLTLLYFMSRMFTCNLYSWYLFIYYFFHRINSKTLTWLVQSFQF